MRADPKGVGRPRLTVIPGGRASEPAAPRRAPRRPAPEPVPATPPPARRTARSALAGLGRAPRTSGGPVNGPSRRTWGFVFAIAGMIGVALAAWGGQPLLGGGLGLIAVAGCIAPPGVPHDPRSRTVRAAGALSAGGVLLVAADLVVGLL